MAGIFYGWFVVLACFLVAFLMNGAVAMGFTAFFEPIARDFDWSYTQISIAASLRGLEMGVFAPAMGFVVDRFGARKLVFCGTFAVGSGFMVLSHVHSLFMFYVAFAIIGVGTSACTGVVLTPAVANWFRRDLGKALGFMASGFGLGGLIIPIITHLINVYQWRTTCLTVGFGIWLIGIPASLVIRQNPEQYGYLPDGAPADRAKSLAPFEDQEVGLRGAMRTSVFWHITIAESIRLMALMAVVTHLMPYLSTLGMSRTKASLVTTCIPLFSITGRAGFGWLGDRYDRWRVMALVYLTGGLGVLAFAYMETRWLLLPFLAFIPLSWGAAPVRGAIFRDYFGRRSLGTIIGIMAGFGTLARVMGPSLAGWVYDMFGRYQPIWRFYASTFLVAFLLMLIPKRPVRRLG